MTGQFIKIRKASENNLKSVDVDIPKNKFTVVSGVSGSGKSSLIYDVLFQEANNLYLGSFSSGARQLFGKMKKPAVESVTGITPSLSVDQKTIQRNSRSTVGTMTGIYEYLRLLFARLGRSDRNIVINRSLFSFNSVSGACPVCKGLGVEDYLDPELLVADETKSIRDRALVITAPNGYIIYSQVTMVVMDQVCNAEGFSVDIPWKDLTPEQKKIILYGSDKIEIPYGKHTLESRMKWSGITAKPRETGFYKGIIPVMEVILKRDRNANILRFVRTVPCHACNGKRLNDDALSVKLNDLNIDDLSSMQIDELEENLKRFQFSGAQKETAAPIIEAISGIIKILKDLGLGYLTCSRESSTLSGGEAQRIRLAVQTGTGLTGLTYLFDEPSVGLHHRDSLKLISILKTLRDKGNTVIVIEHDEEFIRHADWLIDIGPGAGVFGGELLYSGPVPQIFHTDEKIISTSRTLSYLLGREKSEIRKKELNNKKWITLENAKANNLKSIDVRFLLKGLNVVTGVSGAGKSSLVDDTLGNALKEMISGRKPAIKLEGAEEITAVVTIDQAPIGRTPRSNPATYTGMSDQIRDLFARQPEALEKGYTKSHFSFNTEGGRCEACQGAGYQQTGMHFMGNVEVVCEVCEGKRFKDEILQIKFRGKSISDVLEMFISEALEFFHDQPKIMQYLKVLDELGLGYLKTGQRSSTLSGGEAQRIKLATELAKPYSKPVLYLLDEPTTGLHQADVEKLLKSLFRLNEQGNTIVVTEHHPVVIMAADHVIDLGPESGKDGGYVVASGTPEDIISCERSYTGKALSESQKPFICIPDISASSAEISKEIRITGASVNNLKNVSVSIPKERITVITGVSGSGKSSLAYDTIFAEGKNRFLESFSAYVRTRTGMERKAEFEEISGLTPVLGTDQHNYGSTARSTVGTYTGIYDLYRLLYSRAASSAILQTPVLSSLFAFNHQHGACTFCKGLGRITTCDAEKLITDPEKPLISGALDGSKTGKFYGDPFGQYISTLKAAGKEFNIDYSVPWKSLSEKAKEIALFGTGGEVYDVTWEYKRGDRTGSHHFKGPWKGFLNLVDEEYVRKHADHRGDEMLPLMKDIVCPECKGKRLNKEALSFRIGGMDISDFSELPMKKAEEFMLNSEDFLKDKNLIARAADLKNEILSRLRVLIRLGLPYLQISREISTLSGGELQRLKLAAMPASGLTGITYIADEPTLGLHPADTQKLITILKETADNGNTVIVVEHDREIILSADNIIETGPGAGISGGNIVASGKLKDIRNNEDFLTGRYLKKKISINLNPREVRKPGIIISGASANNLKNIDVEIPTGGIILITGVSGAGKSTLLFDILLKSATDKRTSGCKEIKGLESFEKIVPLIQKPSFSSSNGTPATFTGIFDRIREIFADTDAAKEKGFGKNHFSFNNKEGRCPDCEGRGIKRVSMDFLPDVETVCETCSGKRYRKEILECQFREKNIADILEMNISGLKDFFLEDSIHPKNKILKKIPELLESTGLGYLIAGQTLDSLSGGEARRLILANELSANTGKNVLYLFEEPSAGLHPQDTEHLLTLFQMLSGQGHTLLVIDHDPEVIAAADYIIDLGPGGGDEGGEIIFSGKPEDLLKSDISATGRYLGKLSGAE